MEEYSNVQTHCYRVEKEKLLAASHLWGHLNHKGRSADKGQASQSQESPF